MLLPWPAFEEAGLAAPPPPCAPKMDGRPASTGCTLALCPCVGEDTEEDPAPGRAEELLMLSSKLPKWDMDERDRCPFMLSSGLGAIRTVPRRDRAWFSRRLGA